MARRIPPWVVILAFAVVVGGAVGLFAYLRGRSHRDAFCEARLPTVAQRETSRTSHRGFCQIRFGDGALVLTRVKPADFEARRNELAAELVPAEQPVRAALFRTTVQATAPALVGLVARDHDLVELRFDPRVYTEDQALEVMRRVAARFR